MKLQLLCGCSVQNKKIMVKLQAFKAGVQYGNSKRVIGNFLIEVSKMKCLSF